MKHIAGPAGPHPGPEVPVREDTPAVAWARAKCTECPAEAEAHGSAGYLSDVDDWLLLHVNRTGHVVEYESGTS